MKSLWSDQEASSCRSDLDLLIYASRLIGAEPRLVLWGGGNSSVKSDGVDHTGRPVKILWIKGSGSDMRTIAAAQFTPLKLDDLLLLESREEMSDEEMVDYQSRSLLSPSGSQRPPKPSIETLLHAFLPAPHIYHTHADAICALTDTPEGRRTIAELFGEAVAWVPYLRPGFKLSKITAEAVRRVPAARGVVLDKHGLITWGRSAKEAYLETIRMITAAEKFIGRYKTAKPKSRAGSRAFQSRSPQAVAVASRIAPTLRGEVSRIKPMLLQFENAPELLRFLADPRAVEAAVGPFTPDHLMHIKPWPLVVPVKEKGDTIADRIPEAVEAYRKRYIDYFKRYRPAAEQLTMLDPNPRVILIPRVGMFTTGKDRRACRIARDIYLHTIWVIQSASKISSYRPLPPKDLCDFEYWPLENFKLTLLPPEKELSRRIALVTGGAGAIGRVVAARLAEEGAHLILCDIDLPGCEKVASEINARWGETQALALKVDVANEESVRKGFADAVLAFGGLDVLVSNAGIAVSAPVEGLTLEQWENSLAVNATGHFLVCREAMRIFRRQGIGGNIVVVATKNVLAPGKDFGAYSASKAAQAQLSRILAIEGAEQGVRVNMVNPDGVFENSGLWSPRVREERAKAYNIRVEKIEEFYAQRNLLKRKVLASDVAEAVLFFASERSAKTTGAMLPVDGGVREAFPR